MSFIPRATSATCCEPWSNALSWPAGSRETRPEASMADLNIVGHSHPRVDGLEKVTGSARFSPDIKLPRMIVGKILRSPHPHAKVLRIDTSGAERLAGVKAVVTAADVPARDHRSSTYRFDDRGQ